MPDPSTNRPVATRSTTLIDLLRAYRAPAGHYDELQQSPGVLRPHWQGFAERAGDITPADLTQAQKRLTRQLHENGVTYNLHATGAAPRAWALDTLPHIVPMNEWEQLERGLRQRARLLEAVAADVYGAQRLLADDVLPPAAVFGHPGFLRACHGIRPSSGTFLHLLAFDVARGPDGDWRVIETRSQAPSGAGYALENRLSVSQLFAQAFREQHVQLHAPFFRALRETLIETSPRDGGTPNIVLLTPGPFNETYFEHAYLSRYLGFTLAEGADLTAREDHLFLKTVAGLRPVHAIVRRLDDDFCDPLELRTNSTLGVAGLVQAWRSGRLLLANALGMGVLESPLLPPFLPTICQRLFGESLALQSPELWWDDGEGRMDAGIARLAHTVIKPARPNADAPAVLGPSLDAAAQRTWADRLRADRGRYVLEEYVPLSHVPVWQSGKLESRAVMMRVFLVSDGHGDYKALPGGLSRIAGTERPVVSGQRGGGSKDTWVLSDRPVERVSLLPGRLRAEDVVRSERMVSSRAAEHLFWMGRYAERAENGARLMRAILTRLHDGDGLIADGSRPIVEIGRRNGLLTAPVDTAPAPVAWSAQQFETELIRGLIDDRSIQSVAFNAAETVRVAGAVRDRLSTDNWRVLNRMSETLSRRGMRRPGLSESLELLDQVILSLVAIGGLEMAHMTRDDGWRFMSLGRHLERLLFVTTSVAEVSASEMTESPALLEWLLDVSDSIITYRARYMGRAEWLAVANLLLFDARNPRSAVFQLGKLSKHVPLLPAGDLDALVSTLDHLAAVRTTEPTSGELFPRGDVLADFLERSEQAALQLSDALTLRYFSHVYTAPHATLGS